MKKIGLNMTYQNTFEEIISELKQQKRKEEDIKKISLAYEWAKELHEGQFRISQEPYIVHPIEVAKI